MDPGGLIANSDVDRTRGQSDPGLEVRPAARAGRLIWRVTGPRVASQHHGGAVQGGAWGAMSRSRQRYERALAIYEKVLGPEHPDTAASLNSLGHRQG